MRSFNELNLTWLVGWKPDGGTEIEINLAQLCTPLATYKNFLLLSIASETCCKLRTYKTEEVCVHAYTGKCKPPPGFTPRTKSKNLQLCKIPKLIPIVYLSIHCIINSMIFLINLSKNYNIIIF